MTPLDPDQIQLHALKPGVTQVNLFADADTVYTVDVIIYPDARELELLLESQFPSASIRIRPTQSGVILSGFVDRPEDVASIQAMAEDYYTKVINTIRVGGVQQVMLHVKVMEVSRTKLRSLSMDWANFGNTDFIGQKVSGTISSFNGGTSVTTSGTETVSIALLEAGNSFFAFLEAAREDNLVKNPGRTDAGGRVGSRGDLPVRW